MKSEHLQTIIDESIRLYTGDFRVLESAIGALHIGLKIGWRPLRLIHSHRTFVRYQDILGIDFQDVLPEVGLLADKSVAWRVAKCAENFWDLARGHLPNRNMSV